MSRLTGRQYAVVCSVLFENMGPENHKWKNCFNHTNDVIIISAYVSNRRRSSGLAHIFLIYISS